VSDGDHGTHHGDLGQSARFGSGLSTVYRALDLLVAERRLDDAALVVDVPAFGRQVLRAGRRPLRDDEHGLLGRPPGLYVEPADHGRLEPPDDPLVQSLMVALAELGLRHDRAALTTAATEPAPAPGTAP
jgi:hypothetical protein